VKQKIYIETSVVSYLIANSSRNLIVAARQATTIALWEQLSYYDVFISDIVLQESAKGNKNLAEKRTQALIAFSVLQIDDEAKQLAQELINSKSIPEKCPEDALHIAVAAVNGMDIVVTWNFKHINNPFTRKRIRENIEQHGWNCPELCSPEELLGDEV
jgi:predicted nucleic acid-binding protein